MLNSPYRTGLAALCGLALLAALWIAASEYIALRISPEQDPITRLETVSRFQPWGGLAGRDLAGRLDARWRLDPERAEQVLGWQLGRYPLDPWRWLLRARIDRTLDPDPTLSRLRLEAALAIQPQHRELRWRAANLAQNFGDTDLIADYLRLWLDGQPNQIDRALFIAARWLPDPEERLDRVLPPGEEHLVRAMRHARVSAQPQLARAVWPRLEQPRQADDPAVREYVRVLLSAGDEPAVMQLWQQLDPAYQPGDLPAGHFGFNADGLATFGWELRTPRGVEFSLREDGLPPALRGQTLANGAAPAVLRLDFDGTENVHMFRPRLRFPAPPPGRYRLHGWWRAEQLSTRTLPELRVRELQGPLRQRLPLPSADFDWQTFSLDLELTEPDDRLQLQLVRRRTDAFDRKLTGSLELAGLALQALLPEPAPEPVP